MYSNVFEVPAYAFNFLNQAENKQYSDADSKVVLRSLIF